MWVLNSTALSALCAHAPGTELDAALERNDTGAATGRVFGGDGLLRGDGTAEPPDLRAVIGLLHSYGVTGVSDMTATITTGDVTLIAAALRQDERDTAQLRVVVTGGVDLDLGGLADVVLGPVKIVLEEEDLPGLDELTAAIRAAHHRGRAVAIHCVDRGALVLSLAAWREATVRRGDRLEHGALIGPRLLPVLAELGVTVVTQPHFVAERGEEYRALLDEEDLEDLYRCASLSAAGVALALGTDAPFGHPDPWRAIAAATTRRTRRGAVLGSTEAVPAGTALASFLTRAETPTVARRIVPGAPADLCLLDAPLADVLDDPRADHVAMTLVAGATVFSR
jgi:predicted amidohydrolase YtcJ